MALYNYFSKLGTVPYNGDVVNNIITSIRFKKIVDTNNAVFYPYVVEEGERPDQIAGHYYDDERYAWVVYLSNSIIDPYFEWHLTTEQFSNYIIKKYGSIADASEKILFYRNNWYGDDSLLSVSAYEALAAELKPYWNPIVGYSGVVGSYERKKLDTIVETNRVVELTLNSVSDINIGDKVSQKTSGVVTATGFVKAITTDSIIVNNITGAFAVTAGNVGAVTDKLSNYSKSVTDAAVISTPISTASAAYWEAVDAYTYENELNESRKTIRLLDKQYLNTVEDQMIELLT